MHHIPVTAFSVIDSFIFRSNFPGSAMTNHKKLRHCVGGPELPFPKIRLVCKDAVTLASYDSCMP